MKTIKGLLLGLALLLSAPVASLASQGSCVMPTSGTVSGLTLVQDMNLCNLALQSANSGATAPTNVTPVLGMLWLDTSTNTVKIYDGAQWLPIGHADASGSLWNPPIGGGTGTVASATTTDLCSVPQSSLTISGSTTITGFSNTCRAGQIKALTFSGVVTITYNATSMILPNGGSNIVTAVGDTAWAAYLGGGNWRVLAYQHLDGTALSSSAAFTGAVFFDAPGTFTLASNTNDWSPSGIASLNVIRVTCSSALNVTGLVAPVTDGKVVVIDNVGAANNCTLTSQDTASAAANRFAFDRPIAVRPGRSLTVKYDLTAARWRMWQEVTAQPIAGGFKNLKITNDATNGTTLNSNLVGTADQVTVEDVNGGAARLSTFSCSAALTTSGAGGLDTGSPATATWYSYWAIFNPTTNTQNCLLSLADGSGSQPTMPSGYTFKARLGWGRTQTSTSAFFLRTIQYGRRAQYQVTAATNTAAYPVIASGNTSGAQSISTFVPTTASVIYVTASVNSSGATTVGANTSATLFSGSMASVSPGTVFSLTGGLVLESTSIFYAGTLSNSSVAAVGWDDNL